MVTRQEVEPGWRGLAGAPVRFLLSAWPWRSLAYLLTGALVAAVWLLATLSVLVVPALGLLVLLAGIPLGAVERWRLRLVDPTPAPSPHARLRRPGPWGFFATRSRETATWRELGYALLFSLGLAWLDAVVAMLFGCALYLVVYPALVGTLPGYQPDALFGVVPSRLPEAFVGTAIGLLILPVVMYLITAYALGRVALTRTLLLGRRDAAPEGLMLELTRSRARILDAMDAQRQRIERDLHDGAQQRLTGLIMTLGLARLRLAETESGDGRKLVDAAYEQARTALAELRELVHGIHPQVLTDRGLAPAVTELAERCPVPVDVEVDLPRRPPEPVEAAAWFVVSEALTNMARHSSARHGSVTARQRGRTLHLEIRDDGAGGADPDRGTGLVGLADRVAVLGGRITVTSPVGGPTVLRVELPCGS